ncbi:MAG: type II toxin-antitoxin system RelE/ParE family toxin [Bacteroidetes bacterium]|nr:type II toxin-antitoxin system RelE/ParE family toxin [Bacteroidota bacterium]
MSYALSVKAAASLEIEEAYAYYEEQSKGLGDRFIEEVEDTLGYIAKYPLHFQVITDTFRQALLRRFPFAIVYDVSDTKITVYSVFHTSRDPETKFT